MQDLNEPNEHTSHVLTLGDYRAFCSAESFQGIGDELVEKAGPGVPRVEAYTADRAEALVQEALAEAKQPFKQNSSFGGELVVDDEAKARIEAQHASLNGSGAVSVSAGSQFYATGTRMADVGYQNQQARAEEHASKLPLAECARQLADRVRAEKRRDIKCTAGKLAQQLEANGRVKAFGFGMSEQAIRGLLSRLESPALGYVLGLRDRIVRELGEEKPDRGAVERDKARLADTLRHECDRNPDVELALRTREGVGDCFAVVSPSYVPADAPEVLEQLVKQLPPDARATYSYDPRSTTWELRASVWTPTPVHEQAVGEPFEGYVSLSSRDNGTRSFRGGGGIILLACLNAGTYATDAAGVVRRHQGGILVDLEKLLKKSAAAIDALVEAWGQAREEVVDVSEGIKIEDAIPDFYTSMLLDRKSELVGVLPGRTKEHVKGLSEAYFSERRDRDRVVVSDIAQGWTRYIQGQQPDVRREAEAAIGRWLVN